jgi:hypothetical protein
MVSSTGLHSDSANNGAYRMSKRIGVLLCLLQAEQRGAVIAMVAAALFGIAGVGALSVDVGYIVFQQRVLQTTADAAAMAGALDIGTGGTPIVTATSYSAVAGNKNARSNLSATMVGGYPQLKCFSSTGVACTTNQTPTTLANAIQVKQQAAVPLFFGRIFGLPSITISATSTAGASGGVGVPHPLNVAFILDTTASMSDQSTDPSCPHTSALACAVAGVQTLLGELWPCGQGLASCAGQAPVDEAAFFVFPPVTNASQAVADIGCTSPQIAPSYSGVSNTTSAATTTSTLSLNTSMTALTEFNTGSPWAVVTDLGTPTSSATSSGKVLKFPSGVVTTHINAGMTILDTTTPGAIPSGTTVSSISTASSQVTMSSNVTGSGVKSGDLITFGTSIPAGTGGNSWPWWENTGSTTISSVTLPKTATMSANPTGPGVLNGDKIFVAPLYQIVGFANDYRTSDTAGLNAASNIVKLTAAGCIKNPGGLGTFYADAITAAQTALIAEQNARIAAGQPGGTNVIVLLSDGAATSTSQQMGPLKTAQVNQECHLAITAAQAAATAGTWVYSIYYDDGSPNCSDTTAITSCSAMKQIASDSTKFFSTDGTSNPCASSNPFTSITQIFQNVGSSIHSITNTRMLPDNTT